MVRLLHWVLDGILRWPLLFWSCVVANSLGVVIGGWFWYGGMLTSAPLWALPFIPDCPLAALLGTIALFGLRARRRWGFFYALTAFGCIKYGLWTMAFWLRHWTAGGEIEPVGLLMFITHIGLTCEGLLIAPHSVPLGMPARLAVTGWYALSVFVDYGLVGYAVRAFGFPFYPPLSPEVPMSYAFAVATALTALLGSALLALPRRLPAAPGQAATTRAPIADREGLGESEALP
jgi:uncharacterized membrane protein YpjA